MSEEKKSLSRRSFLKGAAVAGAVAAVPGSGLFVQPLEAAKKEFKRSTVKEPQGVKEDKDFVPLAKNLGEASVQGAYDAFNAATEDFVKGKSKKMNTNALLAKQGLKLRSSEAKNSAKAFNAPPSVLKVRELQLKQKGWHIHASASIWGWYWHAHVSW
jgi:hypothetical protein